MIKTVHNYEYIGETPEQGYNFIGSSTGSKHLIPSVLPFSNPSESHLCLDVGFGRGELGNILKSSHPDIIVDGVDAWPKTCHNPNLTKYYRNIWCEDILNIPGSFYEKYDYIFMLDVIEHFDKLQAYHILRGLLWGMNDNAKLIISTPLWFYPQDHVEPGDFEKHKCVIPAEVWSKLKPENYNINPQDLVGMFVLNRRALFNMDSFIPLDDTAYDKSNAKRAISLLDWTTQDGWHTP